MRLCTCTLALLCLLPAPLRAWGRRGHEIVATLACRDLPAGPAAWFQGAESTLRDHCNDPDLWKEGDPTEGPRHFLDSEAYGGPAGVPLSRAEAEARLGTEAFLRNGQVPWVVQEQVDRLAEAFQAGDPDTIWFRAAILSHYVGDLNVPLHTTANYNGQFTGQKGVHHRWETGLVERLGDWQPAERVAVLEPDARNAPWRWLRESFVLVAPLLRDDLEAHGGGFEDLEPERQSTYWREFNRTQGPVVRDQLNRAGRRAAEMILLAWEQAGRPARQARRNAKA
jgi:hypothetical protein